MLGVALALVLSMCGNEALVLIRTPPDQVKSTLAALLAACATTPPTPDPGSPIFAAPVEAAAAFALRTYVDEATRAHGVVCLELEGEPDPRHVVDRLSTTARRLSLDRSDCVGRSEPTAMLSVGKPEVMGERALVDVGVALGSGGTLELEHRGGSWHVTRVLRPWIAAAEAAKVRCTFNGSWPD